MPYVNIKITDEAVTNEQKQALIKGTTQLLVAVFMGAMTYIGNGPNFMVKAIAEQTGLRMPSFFGFMFKYSVPVLVPVLILITLLFLI